MEFRARRPHVQPPPGGEAVWLLEARSTVKLLGTILTMLDFNQAKGIFATAASGYHY
jgi:hypothetical protein